MTSAKKQEMTWGTAGTIFALVVMILFGLAMCKEDRTAQRSSPTPQSQQSSPQKWYQGGTLHDATMGEWYRASRRDRLATCADFVTFMLNHQGQSPRDMAHLRELASSLVICTSEAGDDIQLHGMKVKESAASCWVLMGE